MEIFFKEGKTQEENQFVTHHTFAEMEDFMALDFDEETGALSKKCAEEFMEASNVVTLNLLEACGYDIPTYNHVCMAVYKEGMVIFNNYENLPAASVSYGMRVANINFGELVDLMEYCRESLLNSKGIDAGDYESLSKMTSDKLHDVQDLLCRDIRRRIREMKYDIVINKSIEADRLKKLTQDSSNIEDTGKTHILNAEFPNMSQLIDFARLVAEPFIKRTESILWKTHNGYMIQIRTNVDVDTLNSSFAYEKAREMGGRIVHNDQLNTVNRLEKINMDNPLMKLHNV
ncbi:MAG: hypothetical protein J5525_13270 [Lachnospiraceae bacterium]|nr:hypothetical protein [Lachnospiraceae bacterium]